MMNLTVSSAESIRQFQPELFTPIARTKNCEECGGLFAPKDNQSFPRARFCSSLCGKRWHDRHRIKKAGIAGTAFNSTFRVPERNCAVCLYRVGFGIKATGKMVGKNHGLIRRWAIEAGVFDPSSRLQFRINRERLGSKKQALYEWVWNQERRGLRVGDESTHWGNHPEVSKWRYSKNADIIKAKVRAYHISKKACPEYRAKKRAHCRKWASLNGAKKKASTANWKKNNPEKWRELRRRQDKNPKHRIPRNLRRRVRDFLCNGERVLATAQLVGCSRGFLIRWIEGQFKRGMSWGNYGEWHIDHIIPCAAFDLRDADQQRRCFHYSNLQPLWAADNLAKSDAIARPIQPEIPIQIEVGKLCR